MEIGMGGTASKLIDSGAKLISFVVTDGRRSTSLYGLSEDEVAEQREAEVREAVGILGVEYLMLLRLGDVNSDENRKHYQSELRSAVKRFKPDEIYMPHPEIDKHPTHGAVSVIALEILRAMPKGDLPSSFKIWSYEVWTPFPSYDRIEDITLQMHIKSAAIDAHRSQTDYKNYTDGMKGLNRYRAVFDETSGISIMEYAEVFIEIGL
jgi:N-acetylglucosamine malate deacetylase 1